jgi:hypothetical protein
MTIEQTIDISEPVPAGTATFRLELENEELDRLKNLDTPLRRKYPTLISMIGSCKGLDTMDEYFARKKAEKDKELAQERRYT